MSALEQTVPEGYKQTEVGVIPTDWEVSTIAEKHTLATGSTPPTSNPKNYGGDYLFVSPADLGGHKYIFKTEKSLSNEGTRLARKYPKGSTLFTCIGSTIGKTGLATKELSSNQQINAVFPNGQCDDEFTYYALTYIAPKVKLLAGQQAVPLVNKTEFGETLYCLPRCSKEQAAIANALSDVDGLLTELEKLIAKKQAIKTATMQQLLTGKTRLPQFATYTEGEKQGQPKGTKPSEIGEIPEDWEITKVKNVASVIDSLHKTPSFSEAGFSMVRVADIKTGNLNLEKTLKVNKSVFVDFTRNYTPKKGDIVLSRVGSYGVSSYVETDEPFCIGQNTVVINSKISSKYLYYILNSPSTRTQIEDGSYGSGYKSLSLKNINELKLPLPIEEEQTAIATILSDMDNEIQTLEQRLAKTRQIKQGMMQELLTGRTRLPFEKEK